MCISSRCGRADPQPAAPAPAACRWVHLYVAELRLPRREPRATTALGRAGFIRVDPSRRRNSVDGKKNRLRFLPRYPN
jgi:hypothetical protein